VSGVAWVPLLGRVAGLSLLSVGGALTVAPELHRLLVGRLGLLSDAQFSASVALAQSAPGPNALYTALLGYQLSGVGGAALTLAAFMAPSSALALAAARWGGARQGTRTVRAFKAGLAPVSVALIAATAWLLASGAGGPAALALSAAAALAVWRTRVHLLWLLGAGALLGSLGLV
jgi:chromate transporter